jgi:hypothetical protein
MSRRLVLVAFGAFVVAGCSRAESPVVREAPAPVASTPQASPQSTHADVAGLDLPAARAELASAEKALGDAMALASPDCQLAAHLRDRICELSARICELSARSPDPSVTRDCEDGKARCDGAKMRVGARCG